MIALAIDAQAMTPAELRQAFAAAAVIELDDIQGDILRAYGNRSAGRRTCSSRCATRPPAARGSAA